MNNISVFLSGFFLTMFQHIGSVIISIVLIVVGALWSTVTLWCGIGLLIANVIVAAVAGIRMVGYVNYRTDDPEFNEMMDKLQSDPKAFLSDVMDAQETNKLLHGEELLTLSNDDLFEAVYFQNLDIASEAEDEAQELAQFAGARRTVYVLSTFDAEMQNGGLCQFFVNSSRAVAPFVSEALACIGAAEHQALLEEFVADNGIDLADLESYKIFNKRGYIRQTRRHAFDDFDNKYYELPALQEKIVAFIKENIDEF